MESCRTLTHYEPANNNYLNSLRLRRFCKHECAVSADPFRSDRTGAVDGHDSVGRLASYDRGNIQERPMRKKDRQPYGQFNFLVQFDSGGADHAGFQECSGLGANLEASRTGGKSAANKRVTKITGINKSTDVTLKRGVVSAPALNAWLKEVREGKKAFRDITLVLQAEDPKKPAQKWKLRRARIMKHTSGPLNAKGTEVAMEELVLSYEGIEPV